jgi:type I restriction enzyme S subunit
VLLSIAATVGKAILVGMDACIHDGFVAFSELRLDGEFLYYLLSAKGSQLAGLGQTGTQKNINSAIVSSSAVLLPPAGEQRKIASILSSLDDAIEATQAVMEQLGVVKRAMMAEFFTRGLPGRHTRFNQTEIGPIPEGWEVGRVVDVGEVKLGRMRSPVYTAGSMRAYLRVANVLDGAIETSDVLEMPFENEQFERFRLKPGDILLNEGQSLDLVGRSAVYRGDPPDCGFQKTLLRFRAGASTDTDFAHSLFQWWLYSGRFSENAVQTTSIAHLTGVRFEAMLMPVPPLDEQRQIAKALAGVSDRILAERSAWRCLAQMKAALMSVLLTGEVRVKPDEEPA